MMDSINSLLGTIDSLVWGVPLMALILCGGLMLTVRLGLLQIRRLPLALKWMLRNEEGATGEISSFGALCTALSATCSGCGCPRSSAWQQSMRKASLP